jgi:subtilase family serine protease
MLLKAAWKGEASMSRTPPIRQAAFLAALLLLAGSRTVKPQSRSAQPLIREAVDETKLATLSGNTRAEATAANDLGEVSDALSMDHMMLQLKRSAQQEQALQELLAALHDPQSPLYHQWLSAAEFGRRFGPPQSDLDTISRWLESYGFQINAIYPSRMVIDFSGNAGQVRRAFHTSIHELDSGGVRHIANFSDPQIPAAFAPAVAGIISLHDFRPHKMSRIAKYNYNFNGLTLQAVVPADLATIYDFNPLFSRGITGKGQTIYVIEDSDMYRNSDWTTFQRTFGLTQYGGTLSTTHPQPPSGASNCADPGVNSDDIETEGDSEWAAAAAPGAAIVVASCNDVNTFTDGVTMALQNLVNSPAPPAIMSVSYGICEALYGAAANTAINALYEQAVSEGGSVFVAAGDEGAASCDAGGIEASHGIGISGFASTPNNVAVGGTDFVDVAAGTTGQYWSSQNGSTYGSAISYIPEIPWNDSCASSIIANYLGYATGYGTNGFCNSATAQASGLVAVFGASGGPSNCATGAPSLGGVASGSCKGYAKPSWQSGLPGISGDGVRDIPDVSMFASTGLAWGHSLVECYSDPVNGGGPCVGAPSNWAFVGGTSLSSPVMAGIQALVNEHVGGAQGNPNYVYYALAASTPSAFHSVATGDIDMPCNGMVNCYGIVGTLDYGRNGRVFGTTWGGVLSVSDSTFTPAYDAGKTWNFANGIGSVDANNLVTNWPTKK